LETLSVIDPIVVDVNLEGSGMDAPRVSKIAISQPSTRTPPGRALINLWKSHAPKSLNPLHPPVMYRVTMGTSKWINPVQLVGREAMEAESLRDVCDYWREFFDVFNSHVLL
jgi:hypothetical protein